MHDIINRLRAKKGDEGFTLIELLVVVVIIGVLVAIAVPVYLNYRKGAADKSAQSDVRGAVSAIEQFYTDNSNTYPADTGCHSGPNFLNASFQLGLTAGCTIGLPSGATAAPAGWVVVSDKTQMGYVAVGTTAYRVCANNTGGSGKYYVYDSSKGGSVASSTSSTFSLTTCS
jgi:type IV pilus assembly protein PilA